MYWGEGKVESPHITCMWRYIPRWKSTLHLQAYGFQSLEKEATFMQYWSQPWRGLIKSTCLDNEAFAIRIHGNVLDAEPSLTANEPRRLHTQTTGHSHGGTQRSAQGFDDGPMPDTPCKSHVPLHLLQVPSGEVMAVEATGQR